MSKRIQALAEQAKAQADTFPKYNEKFAQLIVQECINWSIKNKYIESEFDAPTFTKGLKRRFGVK